MSSKKLIKRCLELSKQYITNNKKLEPNKHFSFLIQGNTIISIGINRRGNVPKKFKYNFFSNIHSELDAYNKGRGFLDNTKQWYVINIRLNNFLECMNSLCCPCCHSYLQVLGCSKVIYSDFGNKFHKMLL